MSELKEQDKKKIIRTVEKEFPDDMALQQIHIARKILTKGAEAEGLGFIEYIKLLSKSVIKAE